MQHKHLIKLRYIRHPQKTQRFTMRRLLVTSALPYANGAIHIGHMLEHVQTDIWVRFQRMMGNECHYVCADDAHGTATMLSAEKAGIAAETWIESVRAEHAQDFADFLVAHDIYSSTHTPQNRQLAERIYQAARDAGAIVTHEVEQLFDTDKKLFLADRFVKGNCPRCGTPDQNGDNCDACSATYDATELKNPRSMLSDATPVLRTSTHYFFDLSQYAEWLKAWVHSSAVQPEVANKLDEWLNSGVRPWDISRDAPYFGFEIPDAPGKYFYVWLDAPIGYMAGFKQLCERSNNIAFDDFWHASDKTELHHFIGKDIINFHCLFWPTMLHCAGFRTPTRVHTHGFITVDGAKMSKSRGTFVNARTYLNHLDPEYLRYYYAARLTATTDDIDLSLDDFVQRVNAELIGKVVNIAARSAAFINREFDNLLSMECDDAALWERSVAAGESIAQHFDSGDYARALREIMAVADDANSYIAARAPWSMIKQPNGREATQRVCTLGLNLFRLLVIYLKPVLPKLATKVEGFLQIDPLRWSDHTTFLGGHRIALYVPLATRIDPKQVQKMIDASKEDDVAAPASTQTAPAAATSNSNVQAAAAGSLVPNPIKPQIEYDDFAKLDLRVARIERAELVDGADKLLRLTLDLGDGKRQVFAGIRSAYQPAALTGRLTVMIANLAPRKMRFGMSEGMVLAAGPGGNDIFLLSPDNGAAPGMEVK